MLPKDWHAAYPDIYFRHTWLFNNEWINQKFLNLSMYIPINLNLELSSPVPHIDTLAYAAVHWQVDKTSYLWSTKTQSENHCMHFNSVLRTPTKFVLFSNQKLENIFIFKISRQHNYAQDTGNQYSILGCLICLQDCDKTSENESGNL
jgi:hypothetical protein